MLTRLHEVDGTRFFAVPAVLTLLQLLNEYVRLCRAFESMAAEIVQRMCTLLRLFNQMTFEAVLKGRAVTRQTLRKITASNIALCSQCCGLVAQVLPGLQAHLLAVTEKSQGGTLRHAVALLVGDLTKVATEYTDHRTALFAKLGDLLRERYEVHSKKWFAAPHPEATAEDEKDAFGLKPHEALEGLVKDITSMYRVLLKNLTADTVRKIFTKESDGEQWETDDEFDHPRGLGRAEAGGGCAPKNPPENGQDSTWAGAGGARPPARERPPSRPEGVRPHGVARAAPPCSPSSPPGVPPRPAAGAALAGRPPGDWARQAQPAHARLGVAAPGGGRAALQVGRPAGAGLAGAARGSLAAASKALEGQRARLSEQEQLLAELQRQAHEIRQSILQQKADLVELELQQGELVGKVLVPIDRAAPAAPSAPGSTTLMVRNIPMDMTQRRLLDLIDRSGFANRYDFAYLPTDFDAGTSKGHAFVNFVTPSDAREFSEMWNGARLTGAGPVAAVLEVGASRLQGYKENAKRWSGRRLRRTRNHELHPFIAQRLVAG
ncbi:unnamed protein product [Prorocentrum cordatum]|uniref:RRM domain-containing protein n=1 Tax=Prorocentrum cordatum TaxID=2364126 RepID=A0ABN9W4Y9_9DINO|nr:unnamed protein product [Polarella glacialis]